MNPKPRQGTALLEKKGTPNRPKLGASPGRASFSCLAGLAPISPINKNAGWNTEYRYQRIWGRNKQTTSSQFIIEQLRGDTRPHGEEFQEGDEHADLGPSLRALLSPISPESRSIPPIRAGKVKSDLCAQI